MVYNTTDDDTNNVDSLSRQLRRVDTHKTFSQSTPQKPLLSPSSEYHRIYQKGEREENEAFSDCWTYNDMDRIYPQHRALSAHTRLPCRRMMRSCVSGEWWGGWLGVGELQYFLLSLARSLSFRFFLSKIQLQSMNGMEWNWCPPWLLWRGWVSVQRWLLWGDDISVWGRGFNKGKQIMFIWNIFLVCSWESEIYILWGSKQTISELGASEKKTKKKDEENISERRAAEKIRASQIGIQYRV